MSDLKYFTNKIEQIKQEEAEKVEDIISEYFIKKIKEIKSDAENDGVDFNECWRRALVDIERYKTENKIEFKNLTEQFVKDNKQFFSKFSLQ